MIIQEDEMLGKDKLRKLSQEFVPGRVDKVVKGTFIINTVLYCTELYCTVLYCTLGHTLSIRQSQFADLAVQ